MVLDKTLESPLDCKGIQPVHPKGDQSWVFIERTDVEAETPILWPHDAKSWLIWKDTAAGKDWGQEEKRTTKDEMVGWHHRLNGYEFGWSLGVGDEQVGMACSGSWGLKESDTTEWLNWTEGLSQVLKNERYAATMCMLGAQSCLTLCNPKNCSPPGSSVHGILQSRVLEWVAISFSRGSSQSRDPTPGLLHCKQFLYCLNHQVSPTRWWGGGEGWEEHSLPQRGSQNCKPGVAEASLEVLDRLVCWLLDGVTDLSSTNLWLPHLQSLIAE